MNFDEKYYVQYFRFGIVDVGIEVDIVVDTAVVVADIEVDMVVDIEIVVDNYFKNVVYYYY